MDISKDDFEQILFALRYVATYHPDRLVQQSALTMTLKMIDKAIDKEKI